MCIIFRLGGAKNDTQRIEHHRQAKVLNVLVSILDTQGKLDIEQLDTLATFPKRAVSVALLICRS
jgi:hypothetical protein